MPRFLQLDYVLEVELELHHQRGAFNHQVQQQVPGGARVGEKIARPKRALTVQTRPLTCSQSREDE